MSSDSFTIGFDYEVYAHEGLPVPITVSIRNHLIVVGGTGSGKSTALLYWLFKARNLPCKYYIADFKASGELSGITPYYAEFEQCYSLIKNFYGMFLQTPEGGDGSIKILLIDEIAGMLSHLGMNKIDKTKADEIRSMLSTISMLGRSRDIFLWLSCQRYSATIFSSSSGAGDNFNVCVGLGHLTPDGRKGLFSGMELENESSLLMGQGKGIVFIEGLPLKSIILPRLSKKKLQEILRQ